MIKVYDGIITFPCQCTLPISELEGKDYVECDCGSYKVESGEIHGNTISCS